MHYEKEQIGKRIKELRQTANWSQSVLGGKLNVSGKQVSNYESGKLAPPVDMLFSLCEVFNCELGYLLGDPEYENKTKLMTLITNETGLDITSIEAIKSLTGNTRDCVEWGHRSTEYRCVINKLLSDPEFSFFIQKLVSLYEHMNDWHGAFDDLYSNHSDDVIEQAFYYYWGPIDYAHDESIILSPEVADAIKGIDAAIDDQRDISFDIKYARFETYQAALDLLNQLYQNEHIPEL